MKARKFNSALEATLFNETMPVEMFHNLLNIFKKIFRSGTSIGKFAAVNGA
ncbi:MAG: hypothetical protein U0V48_12125 [Anaerolineales bacterium]